MKKRLLVLLVCVSLIAAMFVGCTTNKTADSETTEDTAKVETSEDVTVEEEEVVEATEEDGLLIGVVLGDLGNSIHLQIGTTMTEEAEKRGGSVILKETGGDAAKLVEILENFIVAGCDVIVQQNIDQTITESVNKQAVDAGINLISFDAEMDLADVCYVADNYELGYITGVMAGEWANENLDGKAKFGLLTASYFDFIVVRQSGIEDGLRDTSPNSEIVIEDDAISVIDGASASENFLQAFPDLNGVIGITDANILGAYETFKSAGKVDESIGLFSCDMSDQGAEAVKEASIFRGAIFLSPTAIAIGMTEDAYLIANDEPHGEHVKYFPMQPVNAENIGEYVE